MKNLKIIGGILITLSIFFSVLNRTSINQNSNSNPDNVSSNINDTNNNKNGGSNNVGGGADINNSKVSVNDFVKGQIDNYKKESNIKQNTTKVVIDSGDGSNMLSYFYNISYNAYSKDGGGETPETYSASGYTPYNYVLGSENDDIKGNNQNGYVAAGDFLDTLKIHMPYNYQGTSTIHWASYAIKHEVELAQSMGLVKYFTIKATGILTCPSINIYANINGKDEMIGGFGVYDFYNTNGLWAISLMTITSAILLGAAVTSTSMGIGFAAYKFRNMIKDAFSVGRLLGGMGDIGDFDVDATNISSYLNDDSPVQNLDNSVTNINNATNHNIDVHTPQSDSGIESRSANSDHQPVSRRLGSRYEDVVVSRIDNNESASVESTSSASVMDINEESATNFHQEDVVNTATPDLVEPGYQTVGDFLSHNVDDIDFSSDELQTQIFWSDYASSEAFFNMGFESTYTINTEIAESARLLQIKETNRIVRRAFGHYGFDPEDKGFISWLKSSTLMENEGFSEIYTNYEVSMSFESDVTSGARFQRHIDITDNYKLQLQQYNDSIRYFDSCLASYNDALSNGQDMTNVTQNLKDSYIQLSKAWNTMSEAKSSLHSYIQSVIKDKNWLDSFEGISDNTIKSWLLTHLRSGIFVGTYEVFWSEANNASKIYKNAFLVNPTRTVNNINDTVLINKLDYFVSNAQYKYQLLTVEDETINNLNFNKKLLSRMGKYMKKKYDVAYANHEQAIEQFVFDSESAGILTSDEISQEADFMNQSIANSNNRREILELYKKYDEIIQQHELISERITHYHNIYLERLNEYNSVFDGYDAESLSEPNKLMHIQSYRKKILEAQIQRDNYIEQEKIILDNAKNLTDEMASRINRFRFLILHSEKFTPVKGPVNII